MEIDWYQLPIPDWGLTCPTCGYPLRGLPQHRCPECGTDLDMAALIRPWTRLRDPRFTGRERPLPDFGLLCRACGRALAGAPRDVCLHCGRQFDVEDWRPPREWFVLDAALVGPLPIPGVQALLANELVPHFPVGELSVAEIYGGRSSTINALRIPREFYFEVRWLVQRALADLRAARAARGRGDWRCAACDAPNPGHFELCWNCERPRGTGP